MPEQHDPLPSQKSAYNLQLALYTGCSSISVVLYLQFHIRGFKQLEIV